MAYIVDQLFPPVNDREESSEFSSFTFWREPLFDINCDDFLDSNAPPAPTNAQNQLPRVQRTPATPVSESDLPVILEKA